MAACRRQERGMSGNSEETGIWNFLNSLLAENSCCCAPLIDRLLAPNNQSLDDILSNNQITKQITN